MAGAIYLFFIWAAWIFVTFILDIDKRGRSWAVSLLLIIIISSSFTISLLFYEVNGAFILLLMISYYIVSKYSLHKKIYFLFSVLAVMVGYAGFQLLEMYDPVLMLMDRRIVICFFLIFCAYVIYPSSPLFRIIFIGLGTLQGEILYALLLAKWDMPYLIGSMEYFDILSITFFALITMHYFVQLLSISKWTSSKKVHY